MTDRPGAAPDLVDGNCPLEIVFCSLSYKTSLPVNGYVIFIGEGLASAAASPTFL